MTDARGDDSYGGPENGDALDARLGRHAVGLLEAARETGDATLIALAEAAAMAAGMVLASRMREDGRSITD